MKFDYDLQLLAATAIILGLGVLIQASLSPQTLNFHLFYIVVGLIFGFGMSKIDYQVLRNFSVHIYLTTLFLLILTWFIATTTRGVRSWIDLGFFQLQTSEVAKLGLILIIPEWISKFGLNDFKKNLQLGFLLAIPLSMVFFQPDLGTTLILMFISLIIIFIGGINKMYIVTGLACLIAAMPVSYLVMRDYQRARIQTFLNPTSDPLGKGYNTIQSQIAVGSGKIFGRGLGHGTQSKLRFLPEYRTDFVFASLAEELGLIGSLLLIVAYGWLIVRILIMAIESDRFYDSLVFTGITSMFISQTIINIGMNIGIMPVTGITLPLVSAGGSSMVVSLASIGVALGLYKKRRFTPGIEISSKAK